MLTRIEITGFKNIVGFSVDFGAFTCIAGANAAGKSNLFDAIQLLSLLADHSLMEAAQQVRATGEQRAGDPRDLFFDGYRSEQPRMDLAVEMIVPREVEDDFGQPATPSITFLRYELSIGYEPPSGPRKSGRMVLLKEQLQHINVGDAPHRLHFPHSASQWRAPLVTGRRSGTEFISTEISQAETLVKIHQDGGSRGQPKVAAAGRAPATVVSTITQASQPTILAARREMQNWKRVALEPSAMRAADNYIDPDYIEPTGRHLAAALYRVAHMPGSVPSDVYASVASRLASLTGVQARGVTVREDDARQAFTLVVTEPSGIELPARSLSEGTLRFLALCVLLEDPSVTGVICMEEPENGIHPANLPAMVDVVNDLAMDVSQAPGDDNPVRQVIVNTHSPGVVQLVSPADLLFADTTLSPFPDERGSFLRLRPMVGTWRALAHPDQPAIGKLDLIAYLTEPPGAQLRLSEPTISE